MDGDSLKHPEKYYKFDENYDNSYEVSDREKRSFNGESDYYVNNYERYVNCPMGIYRTDDDSSNQHHHSSSEITTNEHKRSAQLNFKKSYLYDNFCASLHCKIGHLRTDEAAIVRLRFRLWSTTLATVSFC